MKKTFADWEKETGFFAYNPTNFGTKSLTQQEFLDLYNKNPDDFHALNFKDREKFLKDNGYELTRENLFADLSARPKPE